MIRAIFHTGLLLFSATSWAAANGVKVDSVKVDGVKVDAVKVCHLDSWFNQTNQAKNLQLDKESQHIDRENIWLSQLPSLGISAASSTSNSEAFDKLFRVKTLAPFVGVSINLYSGGTLNLNLADNDADQKLLTLERKSARNAWLLNLLNNLYNIKNIQYTIRDIEQQLNFLDKNRQVYQFQVQKGERPEIELDIVSTQINDLRVNSETLKNDYQKGIRNMARQFFIPETAIQNLNYSDIAHCVESSEIKLNQAKLNIAREKKEIELKKINARLLPELNLSAGISPESDGNTVRYRRGEYQVALSASVNLSAFFQVNNDKKQAVLRLQQDELRYQDALIAWQTDRDDLINNLKNNQLQLQAAQQSLALGERRLEYVRAQYMNGKNTFITYMDEINRLLTEKNHVSQFENQRDYYEALHYFYN